MKSLGMFLAGFASGWVVRSTVDSSRSLAVSGVSAAFGAVERVRRLLAIEKEHIEDLVAEGKAKHEARLGRAGRAVPANGTGSVSASIPSVPPAVRAA